MSVYDHWMPLNVGDYLADTMHLTTLQHGIYVRLIMHYWRRRGLPAEIAALAQIAGVPTLKFHKHAGPVLALFTVSKHEDSKKPPGVFDSKLDSNPGGFFVLHANTTGGGSGDARAVATRVNGSLTHKRLDREIERARAISETRQRAGLKGAQVRHGLRPDEWQMPQQSAGTCRSPAAARARDSTTTNTKKDSPPEPPRERGGGRAGRFKSLGEKGPAPFRNGFAASVVHDMEAIDATTEPHPAGARVVPITRRT